MRQRRHPVGRALREFRGVLTGVPVYEGRRPRRCAKAPPVTTRPGSSRSTRPGDGADAQRRRHRRVSCSRTAGIDTDTVQSMRVAGSGVSARRRRVLLPEEAMSPAAKSSCCGVLAEQPPWSDLPILVLTRPGADSAVRGATPCARSATSRCSSGRCGDDAPQRGADGASGARAPVPDPRPPRRARENERDAARRRPRKDEFLATLGHELRNPLAPLLTSLQMSRGDSDHEPERGASRGRDGAPGAPSRAPRRRSARSLAHYARA